MLFFGAYIGRYRLEMALAFPFVAWAMVVYFNLAFKADSAAQRPEHLMREPRLLAALAVCVLVLAALLFIDIPALHHAFPPTAIGPAAGR